MRHGALAFLAASILVLAACGGDDDEPGTTATAPETGGASYEVSPDEWLAYDFETQGETGEDFIKDNPGECEDLVAGVRRSAPNFEDPATAPTPGGVLATAAKNEYLFERVAPSEPLANVMLTICRNPPEPNL